jgi:hypothetical protein
LNGRRQANAADASVARPEVTVEMPFASGNVTELCLMLSMNDPLSIKPRLRVGGVELFEVAPTPYQWTCFPRAVLRGIQKNVFKTWVIRVLALSGVAVLVMIRQAGPLAFVLAVPAD